ncbi:uncharacterized protein [Phaseolus vulgaris]|uniref:uncharacterized protein n=1 Tax=Phaseolus vulgaris TaxID=3885 RepID=UPI0035CB4675
MAPCGQVEGPQKESIYYYMGAFMSCAHTWHAQAKAKGVEASAFQTLEKEVTSLKEEKERLDTHWGRQEDAYKTSLRVAQKAKEKANKRVHEVSQANAELLAQVVPLRVKVAELEEAVKTSEAQQKKLEKQCIDREQTLGKTEAALEEKTNESAQLTTENTKLQAQVQELIAALAAKDQDMATQAKNFKVAEEKLNEEAATGFAEALVQEACANPGIDVSRCSPLNEVVDGKIVPLEAPEE